MMCTQIAFVHHVGAKGRVSALNFQTANSGRTTESTQPSVYVHAAEGTCLEEKRPC